MYSVLTCASSVLRTRVGLWGARVQKMPPNATTVSFGGDLGCFGHLQVTYKLDLHSFCAVAPLKKFPELGTGCAAPGVHAWAVGGGGPENAIWILFGMIGMFIRCYTDIYS